MRRLGTGAGVLCLLGIGILKAASPAWWTSGDTAILDPNASHAVSENYTPANQGQLKNVASKAALYLNQSLPSLGAGAEINDMVSGFQHTDSDYSPINLGQLKAVARPFYDRLLDLGYDTKASLIAHGYPSIANGAPSDWAYGTPWDPNTPAADNYAPANLGQLKMAFGFDLDAGSLAMPNRTLTIDEDTIGVLELYSFGGGPGTTTYQILSAPAHGTAELSGTVVSYYPNAHYNGSDSFTLQVTKGGQTRVGTVSVTVRPVDNPPLVSVGGGQTVTLPGTASLNATITDIDTSPSAITHTWIKVSGPGEVTFADAGALTTTASFGAAGDYVLRLVASDAQSTRSDSLAVTVNAASAVVPTVTLTAPAEGAAYAYGQVIALQATASVSAGTIGKVEFYEGSRKIGEGTPGGGTYSLAWTPGHLGVYTISAAATGSGGGRAFGGSRNVKVTEGNWFLGAATGGNEGYTGTGGDGGATTGGTTGSNGDYTPGSGGNGGGPTAGSGGNGTGAGDDDDLDQDGLTFAEEKEAGTNPTEKDTDGDHVDDGVDGWPLDKDLSPPRLPNTVYAVINLAESGIYWADSLNDSAEILGWASDPQGESAQLLWSQGETASLPQSGDQYVNINWHSFNATGAMVGYGEKEGTNASMNIDILMRVNEQIIPLPHYAGNAPEDEGRVYEQYWPFITSSGRIFSEVFNTAYHSSENTSYNYANRGIVFSTGEAFSPVGAYCSRTTTQTFPNNPVFTQLPNSNFKSLEDLLNINDFGVLLGNVYRYYLDSESYPGSPRWAEEQINGGFFDGANLYVLSELAGSDAEHWNFPAAVSNSATDPWIVGNSGDHLSIWAKRPSWKRVYDPTNGFGSRIDGLPSDINEHGEIVGRDFHSPKFQSIQDGQFIHNGKIINLTELVAGYTISWAKNINKNGAILAYGSSIGSASEVVDPLLLVPCDIVPDLNRDGKIDNLDQGKITKDRPWRWWENDDSDTGDVGNGDTDQPLTETNYNNKNFKNHIVDGRADLLDFAPLWLNIKQLVDVLQPGTFTYKFKQEDEALNVVFTDLTKADAGKYLKQDYTTKFGSALNSPPQSADTVQVRSFGTEIPAAFLNKIKDDENKGVILVEGAAKTTKPLVLEVYKGGDKVAELSFNISIDGVEKMYRWVNLRGVQGVDGGIIRSTSLAQPENYPDELTNNKNFVFVHGYSVREQQARGWNAEMFKRLHQLGSKAKFIAVTWRGDEGKLSDWIPWLGGSTPDYYENVINAFLTAPHLASAVNGLSGKKYIAAHSLGNMVATSAIKDYAMNVEKYLMIDAAVAMEAYDASLESDSTMRARSTNPAWGGYNPYSSRLWSTEWYKLFNSSDGRNRLTWRGRFGNIGNATNYYSGTEDVLKNNPDGSVPSVDFQQGILAWSKQEMEKGSALIELVTWDSHGGWGFNSDWDITVGIDPVDGETIKRHRYPEETTSLTDEQLRSNSFFKKFADSRLYNASQGSAAASEYNTRSKMLAEGLPALSFAAGANAIDLFEDRNVDMSTLKNGIWPRSGGEWRHSDFREVAFYFTWPVYQNFIDEGELNK